MVFMRNVTKSYVTKSFRMLFIMLLNGLINITKSTIYYFKFEIVTFKLNVAQCILL